LAVKLGDIISNISGVLNKGRHKYDARGAQIIKGAPTRNGKRTSYALVECGCGCGGVKVAPKENFLACTDEHIEKIKAQLRKNNFSLIY
jgi:hypothetical protein